MEHDHAKHYYIPHGSIWPLVGVLGLFCLALGAANWVHGNPYAVEVFCLGALIMLITMFGWFGAVIKESEKGYYNAQVDKTFRWGMAWFIFSEVMFFAAFFGVLFYVRVFALPWLSGDGSKIMTHTLLWENVKDIWPLLQNPDPVRFPNPKGSMPAWGIPAMNTLLLLSSGVTITFAHHALRKNRRFNLMLGLLFTIILGVIFLCFQAYEYYHSYTELGLTLNSGIYGSTFFMLTGFHGAHVTIGALMLAVILLRVVKGHFTPQHHFGFEAAAWYWHFVDVVWLMLFIFVYWL